MMGPKEKKERSLGERLYLKGERCQSPKCAVVRRPYRPGVHGNSKRRRNISDFARQLQEKQKFKLSYGLDERNLRMLFARAKHGGSDVATGLMELLERRLDNAVFRLGFAASRSAGRQLIVHGHIVVNGHRVRSPGFQVSVKDIIGIYAPSRARSAFRELNQTLKNYEQPVWLSLDKEKEEGMVLSRPQAETSLFEINLLVESFSK